ncbi:MAG: DUF3870 domain-containing protein [Aminobacterium sp.]|jgi:hypothetical protein|uniref:DUF3870 domain-containing protein n=1 Tax=bioreactor metagenome TaxID=1076179 RepID=A0A645GU96_9ZZZZ|nr:MULTISPECIES: DUF3870 domain-containing protein [unclassified Aminobacterium]MDD2206609.1 DUF3870 domain-containing protein [Aminobacterium sp.]MDD3425478.1 DUF3870 domain-containing protein [Aminobacterium sp.]MDD3706827.1 DUF3870 domain-containing protein [Aminobacterium sp.]MDD4228644.1 DUF3870 domain-containing protein [Aminobacterium sp.]MDD4551572.1 DUF3870 domain-containing protein [Aminobacterium sp.]
MEKYYPDNSVLIVGNSRTTSDNPITFQFNAFFISFIVERESSLILDCQSSVTLDVTHRFIRDLFVGRYLLQDEQEITEEIQSRYFGSSKKAIQVAYKDALKKYREGL